MPTISIVPDEILSSLMSVRPLDFSQPEVRHEFDRLTGCFDPTADLLRQTIDAVFWASLSEEEGKPVLPRVRFADVRTPYCRLQPREVSATALCKLSPLLDVYSNALLIRSDSTIVGVGQWRHGDMGVLAHRPGRLAVSDGSMVLGVFDRGAWIIVGGSRVNAEQILQKVLSDEEHPNRFLKATLIINLAMRARQAGRGATFVIVPECPPDGIGSISYSVEDFPALPQALEAWRRAKATTPPMAEQQQTRALVRDAIAIAAAGAGIDGATLVDEKDLRLLGFGAKINAPDSDFQIRLVELPNGHAQIIKKEETGRMRHQTAARLVYKNQRAMAITVSQDGPVSLFAWTPRDATVVMIKHLDRYFEAEVFE